MSKNTNTNTDSAVSVPSIEQNIHPASDPRDAYPNEYFDEYMYDDLYYDDLYMSYRHWTGGVCGAEQGICNYEPF